MPTFTETTAATSALWHLIYSRWLPEELFSFSWFIIVGSMTVIYAVLILFIDKRRLRELLLYGTLLALSFSYVDVIGTNSGLWAYRTHFFPLTSNTFPFAYTIHPIVHMLAYQYAPDWHAFAKTNTLATLFFAFVAQPFYVWANVLWLGHWNFYYSFFLAGLLSTIMRVILLKITNIELKNIAKTSQVPIPTQLQPALKPLDKEDENK